MGRRANAHNWGFSVVGLIVMLRLPLVPMWSVALVLCISTQARENPEAGQWFVSPVLAAKESPRAYDVGQSTDVGIAIGYGLTDSFAAELAYLSWSASRGDADSTWLSGLWSLPKARPRFQPYVVFGGGRTAFSPDGGADERRGQVFGGIGAFGDLGARVSWRGDLRAVKTADASPFDPFAQVGVTVFIGNVSAYPPPDRDGDGVPDARDRCPGTPLGRPVDENGCEFPPDDDDDGVENAKDACPGTPDGVAVDNRGCPLDRDGDGVPDYQDDCPDSRAGAKVGTDGCYVLPDPPVEFTIIFDTDDAAIRADQRAVLREGAALLLQYPTAEAVIEGHADSTGRMAYNQGLSERRAASVRDHLIAAGVEPDRLSAVGYGETRPVSDNDSAEGRQANRRATTMTVRVPAAR